MSKALIISDVHIYDYPNHNLTTDFRLGQFSKLSHRLVEIGKQEGCEYLFILGDLIHKPINTPKVVAATTDFLETLSKQFKIKLIYGNHDCSSKSQDIKNSDSALYANFDKFEYVSHRILNIDGKRLAFMNWIPEQDLSWIEGKADYFFGHVCLDERFGQEIDTSKFELGFAGDIHQIRSFDNIHTVNVPIPHYISDEQNGSVIILDIPTGDWKRVATKSDTFKPLRIYYEDTLVEDKDENTVFIERPMTAIQNTVELNKSINLKSVIQEAITTTGLSDLHSEFLEKVSKDTEPVNLNFFLKQIMIENFRSIEQLELNFQAGLYQLAGKNGEGKSSLISAIDFIFNPPRVFKPLIRKGSKEMSVELSIDYQGNTHTIKRTAPSTGSATVAYSINGEPVNGFSTSEINDKIKENLEFIQMFDILYRYQSAPYLLSGYSYADRIELVSKLIGLDSIQEFHSAGKGKLKEAKLTLQGYESKLQNLNSELAGIKSAYTEQDSRILGYFDNGKADISSIVQEAEQLQDKEKAITKSIEEYHKNQQIIQKYRDTQSKLSVLEQSIKLNLSDSEMEELRVNVETGNNVGNQLQQETRSTEASISEANFKIRSLQNEIDLSESQLDRLRRSDNKCSACGRKFDNEAEFLSHIEAEHKKHSELETKNTAEISEIKKTVLDLQAKLETTKKEYNDFLEVYNGMSDKLKIAKQDIEIKRNIETLKNELSSLSIDEIECDVDYLYSEKQAITQRLSELSTLVSNIEKYQLYLDKVSKLEEEITAISDKANGESCNIVRLEEYVKLFHPTGPIVQSVFTQIASNMTEDQFIVQTIKELASGDLRLDFDVQMKVDGLVLDYLSLSGGQKVLADIFFLTKLFKMSGRVGLLMLDETLRDLDSDRLEQVSIMLRNSIINTILLVTHSETFNSYDYKLTVRKENGNSTYQVGG